jgi:hypothetical protein
LHGELKGNASILRSKVVDQRGIEKTAGDGVVEKLYKSVRMDLPLRAEHGLFTARILKAS